MGHVFIRQLFSFQLFLFLTFCSPISCAPCEELVPSTSEEISSLSGTLLIGGFISPLSGQICIHESDLQIQAAQNIALKRNYLPPQILGRYHDRDDFDRFFLTEALSSQEDKRWKINYHLWANFNSSTSYFCVRDPSGFVLTFKIKGKHPNKRGVLKTPIYGFSNLSFNRSGQEGPESTADLRNIECFMEKGLARVIWPDGTERVYRKDSSFWYRLEKELLPNGKAIFYEYEDQQLKKIFSADHEKIHIYATIDRLRLGHYVASDGRKAWYYDTLLKINGKIKPENIKFNYSNFVLRKAKAPDYSNEMQYNDRMLLSSYDAIDYPVSFEYARKRDAIMRVSRLSTPDGSVSLSYKPPQAGKTGGWTKAHYEDGAQILYRFDENLLLTAIENWQNDKIVNQKVFDYDAKQHLSSITTKDGAGAILVSHRYTSDAEGNAIIEKIERDGNIFSIKRSFASKGRLLKEEREDGLGYEYTYLGKTRLLTSKTTTAHGQPLRKTTYHYDVFNNLIEEVEEGLSSIKYSLYDQGAHLHRPEWKEVFDNDKGLASKTHFIYDSWGNIAQEEHFGSDGKLAYTIKKTYDEQGNLLQESNALEQGASYQYDQRKRCIHEVPFSGQLEIDRTFDEKGRLTLLKEGEHKTHFVYNKSDKLIEKVDYLSLKTTYEYDSVHAKPTAIRCPPMRLKLSYDAFGREIERSDAYEATRRVSYNGYSKPTQIIYPDGGIETYSYASNGLLISKTDPDGLTTSFSYDVLGRVLSKTEEGYTTSYIYDAHHLVKKIDPQGILTKYTYDAQGRKIEEERAGRKTRYSYDPLNFLTSVAKENHWMTYQRDTLGQILEKSENGLMKTRFTYLPGGAMGSKTQVGTTVFHYDPYGRLIETIDPQGDKTTTTYKELDQVLVKEIQDPRGVSTVETYNAHGKLLKREMAGSLSETFAYDDALRLTAHDHLTFTYTPAGHRASVTEAGLRTTSWSYTPGGKIQTKTNPDGIKVHYEYNLQGKLIKASSGEFSREFSYDALGRLVQGSGFCRTLDPFGNILREEFSNGLSIETTYNASDKPLSRLLPDQSRIVYEYEGPLLKKLERLSPEGLILYTHSYDQYNEAGSVLSETGLFSTNYAYDQTGFRRIFQSNPYLKEHLSYDPAGNLIQRGATAYTYDKASQLIAESGKFSASYDEHYNCIARNDRSFTLDALNQIEGMAYDANGNQTQSGFLFDVFGQLVQTKNEALNYDALGRRLQKGTTAYLYVDQEEIGAFEAQTSKELKAKELKIAGQQGPVAIEMEGRLYIPIQDVQGIIRLLIDCKTGKIVKTNHCDVFGADLTDEIPYAYQGKRYDAKTGLIYFGKRYYDTHLNRWLTPDPLGNFDHSNLYQYVFNNPLTYCDLHGECVIVIPLLLIGAEIALPTLSVVMTSIAYSAAISAAVYGGYKMAEAINIHVYNTKERPDPPYCGQKLAADPLSPLEEGFEWRGKGEPGSKRGSWVNPETGENLRADLDHKPPIGPHWDYTNADKQSARGFPDGTWEWK